MTRQIGEADHSARGRVTWLSSGEDEGPDVGLIVGLGHNQSVMVGELADRTVRENGLDPDDFPGIGWWVAIEEGDSLRPVGPVADQEAGRALVDALELAFRAPASDLSTLTRERDEAVRLLRERLDAHEFRYGTEETSWTTEARALLATVSATATPSL